MFTQAYNTNPRPCSSCKTMNKPKVREETHGSKIHTIATYVCSNCGTRYANLTLATKDKEQPKIDN